MLQGRLRGDPFSQLSQISLLFQVLYPVFAPRPTQTKPRPEGFVPGRQLARACWLFTSRSRRCAVSPHPRSYPCTSLDGSGGPPTPQGPPRGASVFSLLRSDSWPLSSKAGAQPSRSSEAVAILVPHGCRRDTLFSPQPLFFVHRCLHRIRQEDFRSVECILPLVFGTWRCYYFGWAPFVAPERRTRRAASSTAGHA
ncbi:hypothetical protein NDU88_002612 [Pleurodeles waltl]|uniref:Uncharacterized protein n=1 Tax=Pleurodeles waltl TaxID=8319 RepID=A0AAV7Q9D2_PLEWA|nr:hypothetical protein NDU88_002612 [Pleurodeles waltl]